MAEESLAQAVAEILKLVDSATEVGRARADGAKQFKSTSPEMVEYLMWRLDTLDAVVTRLAREIDAVKDAGRGTPA